MNNLVYHSIEPENKRDEYNEYQTLDFRLDFNGRKFDVNSLKLVGTLEKNEDTDILNCDIGAHSLVDTITLSLENAGVIEEITDYGHYVVKHQITSKTTNDIGFNASQMAGLMNIDSYTHQVALNAGNCPNVVPTKQCDFSVKLMCMLNKAVKGSVNYSKTGTIRVNIRLAPNGKVIKRVENVGITSEASYKLTNVRLNFLSELEDNYTGPLEFQTVQTVKTTLTSKQDSLNATISGNIRSVSTSFQLQENENSTDFDEYRTELLNDVSLVQFLWNDATNRVISYQLTTPQDYLEHFIRSMNAGEVKKHNQLGVMSRANAQGYGFGLDFGEYVANDSNKIRIVVHSDIENAYNAYMCFNCLVVV